MYVLPPADSVPSVINFEMIQLLYSWRHRNIRVCLETLEKMVPVLTD